MFVTTAMLYLFIGLAGCSMDPMISRCARKLTRTPQVIKKKQLRKLSARKFHCHIYLLHLSYLPLLIIKLECKMEASFPHLPTSAIICLKTTILNFFLKNQYFSKILFKHKNKQFHKISIEKLK